MKKFLILALVLAISNQSLQGQSKKESFETRFNKADKLFSAIYQDGKGDQKMRYKAGYVEARKQLGALYKEDPGNRNLAFKLGICYQGSNNEGAEAIPYFINAVSSLTENYHGNSYKERSAPLVALKFLGDAYHLDYQFDLAIASYELFLEQMTQRKSVDEALLVEANRRIQMCKNGKLLMASPVKITIENLGPSLNTAYSEYAPVISADQTSLYFTSRRPASKSGEKDVDGNSWEDIYVSTKTVNGWSMATNIGPPINSVGNESAVGISPDGQRILIYNDDEDLGNIYETTLNGDVWTRPVKMNENINTKYWETRAAISADGNTLYFVSNKPGGYGGRDLYVSSLQKDSTWGKASNMGPVINTIYDEDAPFIHADGVTLSFCSNGHNTMGGFDIFTTLLSQDGIWSAPLNVGYPINTTDDDVFYTVSPDGLKAYFTSFRKEGLGGKDNYVITFLDKKETPLTLVKGSVFDESGKPAEDVVITVTDNETEKVVGYYKTNSKSGAFLFILKPGKNYNITYNAKNHLFYSENIEIPKESNYYEINRAIALNPIVVGSKINLNNIFFDFDKATLRSLSNVELKNLVQLMTSNMNLKVEISGHTDSKGDDAYNMKLSEERAQAVVNRLTEKGIDPSRMKAKGYGKTMPVALNKTKTGEDNPEGRQLNRRVELKITEIN